MTFDDLVNECPELTDIKRAAVGWHDRWDRWEVYEKLKAQMTRCVGWKATANVPEWMRTSEAYSVAHKAIFK